MSSLDKGVSTEGFSSESERRKRLGQYYTGKHLGRVLAALAEVKAATSIIDPMSGTGDLLEACTELGAADTLMGAIEIDPVALRSCMQKLPRVNCVLGDAFSPTSLKKLPRLQWDLVITNPPYVRYQSLSKSSGKESPLPSAFEVRNGLLAEIEILPSLDDVDKELFREIVQGYSGLADLAVPSLILCAGLVAPGGKLALVMPDSWLSRDYAAVIHYILLRWFEIEFVVEDEHANWFSNALVKTTLLVAKRVSRRNGIFDFSPEDSFLRVGVAGKASGVNQPFSRLFHGQSNPEIAFAKRMAELLAAKGHFDSDMIQVSQASFARSSDNLRGTVASQKWFSSMGEILEGGGTVLPYELHDWLNRSATPQTLASLSSLGVQTGQGLRTGANAFFYGVATKEGLIKLSAPLSNSNSFVPEEIGRPAVRRQSDLPSGYCVSPEVTLGRVIDLRRHALPEDIASGGGIASDSYVEMATDLAAVVRNAATADFGKGQERKKIWELSAVRPNIRKGNPSKGLAPRFWYMLPDFAPRHTPDILLARINSGSPKAYLNQDRSCIIDANFVTLWTQEKSVLDAQMLLALLNSAWTAAALEFSAAVMGGGALKVEAAHLKRLPVPLMHDEAYIKLSILGGRLSRASSRKVMSKVCYEIDHLVATQALGREVSNEDLDALRALAARGMKKRKKHKK